MVAEIRFSGPEYDGAEDQLGELAPTFTSIANDASAHKFGGDALPDPSNIEVLPVLIENRPIFILRAWHQAGEDDEVERIQPHDVSFRVLLEGEDAVIQTEEGDSYPITTRGTLALIKVANLALLKTLVPDTPIGQVPGES